MHCNLKSPKAAVALSLRLSFGLTLLLVGVVHYMTLDMFQGMVAEGLGPLSTLGTIWAYLLPALQIVGGALFAVGMYYEVAAWTSGIALGSIPVGMVLKSVLSGVALPEVMGAANNAFIWIIVYALVVKVCCCCGSSCGGGES